jgi:hypothetical protein
LALLRSYCVHASIERELGRQIEAFRPEWLRDPDGLARFGELTRLLNQETRTVLSLARGLRLSPSSRMRPEVATTRTARRQPKSLPWEPVG